MISARSLEKRYGEKQVLAGIDVELPEGGFLLVTGRNGSGKSTLLRLFAGLLRPSGGELSIRAERAAIGYLGHESLVYRELTALENLELFGRLYRVPERRERIGMLLERYGLWDARHERVAAYSRGCSSGSRSAGRSCTTRRCSSSTSPLPASTARGPRCSTASWASCEARARSRSAPTSPSGWRPLPPRLLEPVSAVAQPARTRLTTYLGDVAALVRKDLLLEVRARETVPAMLLFVVSALTVFHFAVPGDLEPATEEAVAKGLLWIAILFTALLGLARAFAAEREQDVLDGLVLAPSDRSAIWLSKTVTVTAFLVLMEIVALPVFALLYAPLDAATIGAVLLADIGIAAVGSLLSAMALASRTGELILPLLFLPLAVPIVVGGVGASIADDPARFVGFLVLYDAIFAIISWAAFEYVVTE